MEAETYFLVVINKDGTITTFSEMPEKLPEVERQANNVDVYQTAVQVVDEFNREILTNRIVSALVSVLNPPQETVADKVKDALKKRNIDPESVAPVE